MPGGEVNISVAFPLDNGRGVSRTKSRIQRGNIPN
nr:MAG TPA: hypothetical protein [Caudoviricetes sp.]DAQ25711.1 MAG TPA: hypothetical protein [Caudoviricetes sp.]